MGFDNHYLDHEYIFLKTDDDREIVMKRNEGRGDHLYNCIGELEDCGDSWQLHTSDDDIIVAGRWWSKKRIGCINGEVGWVCRNNDFITHHLGRIMFAFGNIVMDGIAEMVTGNEIIDEKIKGLTNDEVTAFITGPPYPEPSKKMQRIFFGEVTDESANEDEDDVSDPEPSESSGDSEDSDGSYSGGSSYDYSPSYSTSSPSPKTTSSDGGGGCLLFIFALIVIAIMIMTAKPGQDSISEGEGSSTGGGTVVNDATTGSSSTGGRVERKYQPPDYGRLDSQYRQSKPANQTDRGPAVSPKESAVKKKPEAKTSKPDYSSPNYEANLAAEERERRKNNPANRNKARQAEATGRDALGRSPFDR